MLLFFGASWSQRSQQVALKLKELLKYFNTNSNNATNSSNASSNTKLMELIYISNDESEEDFKHFYDEYFTNYCTFQYGDERILKIKEYYCIDCVPVLVVLDKNLEVV